MSDTDWLPKDVKLPAPGAYLEALGAFVLWFNELEMVLYGFFQRYIEPLSARDYLFAELHNRARVDLITQYVETHHDADFIAAAKHALRCFDICCENRNLIAHAFAEEILTGSDQVAFLKRLKEPRGLLGWYDFTLEEVRATALAARATGQYILGLASWFDSCSEPTEGRITFRPALPSQPPQPRKLSLSRRPTAQKGEPPQPRSSQAKVPPQ